MVCIKKLFLSLCLLISFSSALSNAQSYTCPQTTLTLQVLGSGGPDYHDQRASSSYLIWLDEQAKILIDTGSNSALRLGQARATLNDLNFIGISHLHVDHIAGLFPLLKSGFFSLRTKPLIIVGPSGNTLFPSIIEFLDNHFNPQHGSYRYLNGYQQGSNNLFQLLPYTIDITNQWYKNNKLIDKPHKPFNHWTHTTLNANNQQAVTVYHDDTMRIDALAVPHGNVPALAYRVTINNKIIVFSSDQTGETQAFIDFAQNSDLLIVHMAIAENDTPLAQTLHITPSMIGKVAQKTHAKAVLLSHVMERSLRNWEYNMDLIYKHYTGPVILARDLMCLDLSKKSLL